jgi:hypothetical protein
MLPKRKTSIFWQVVFYYSVASDEMAEVGEEFDVWR